MTQINERRVDAMRRAIIKETGVDPDISLSIMSNHINELLDMVTDPETGEPYDADSDRAHRALLDVFKAARALHTAYVTLLGVNAQSDAYAIQLNERIDVLEAVMRRQEDLIRKLDAAVGSNDGPPPVDEATITPPEVGETT